MPDGVERKHICRPRLKVSWIDTLFNSMLAFTSDEMSIEIIVEPLDASPGAESDNNKGGCPSEKATALHC